MTEEFVSRGFLLTTELMQARSPALVEVYPHVALIQLMRCEERRRYKVHNSKKYWDSTSIPERIALLLNEWHCIIAALKAEIEDVDLHLPETFSTLAAMKAYEDCLDAIISAWVGLQFFLGKATPYGDNNAAIWVPN